MSQSTRSPPIARTWDDPSACPFCLTELADPGAGFMRHLEESPRCAAGFENWRDAVASDMRGEWSG